MLFCEALAGKVLVECPDVGQFCKGIYVFFLCIVVV
jgi:hypothetical protein